MPTKDPEKIKEIRRRFYEKNKKRVKEKVAAYKLAKKLSDPKRQMREKAEREKAIKRKRRYEIYAIVQERKRRNLEREHDHWWRGFCKFFYSLGFVKITINHKRMINGFFSGQEGEMNFEEHFMFWKNLTTSFSLYSSLNGGFFWKSDRMLDDFNRSGNLKYRLIRFEDARRCYIYHCNSRFKESLMIRHERLKSNKEFMARMDEVLKNVDESRSAKTKIVLAFMKMATSIK